MRSRLIIFVFAMFAVFAIASTSVGQGKSTDQQEKFVATEPLSDQVQVLVSIVAENDSNPILVSSNKRKQREATCENPEVMTTLAVSEEERDASIEEATQRLPHDVTPEEVEEVKAAAPAQEFTRQVYVDNAEAIGDPPDPNQDQDGKKFEAWVEKVKKAGCNTQAVPSTGGRLASPAAQYFTSGWKSCTNSTWTTNSVGATLVKLTQTSQWYVDSRGVPYYPSRSFYSYAGWGWDEKGAPQGQTGVVTIWYGSPLQYYNWTGQNFHFSRFGIELFTKYLRVDQYFGYQGRCGIFPWRP